ncbi:NrsF family protein [Acidisoma sp. C75]
MQTDSLIARLSGELRPVRPRSVLREAAILAVLGILEVALFLAMGFMRPDMRLAMEAPSFWWKLVSMGLIAVLGAGIALCSIDPTRSPRRGLRWILVCIAIIFASGWLIDAAQGGVSHLLLRLDWRQGLQCAWKMIALSIPAVVALGFLIRRGAPSDERGTALAAALASAGWGAFVFVFACPSNDPLYIAVWYTLGCGIVTLIGQITISRLARW